MYNSSEYTTPLQLQAGQGGQSARVWSAGWTGQAWADRRARVGSEEALRGRERERERERELLKEFKEFSFCAVITT
jgi:hypothetical protein